MHFDDKSINYLRVNLTVLFVRCAQPQFYLSVSRSAARGDMFVPRSSLQLGNLAFCVACPVA